jgi:diguanylate cyclase (GGDEF)-like protein
MAANLRALRFPEHPELTITLSIGIAAVPEHADNLGGVKEAADKAVYAAKEAGRDRAAIAGRTL